MIGARGGKAQVFGSQILTATGFKRIEDIRVGEVLREPINGGIQTVTALHPWEEHEYFRITFDDGTTVECSSGHLWTARSTRDWRGGIDKAWHNYDTRSIYNLFSEWSECYKEKHWSPALIVPLATASEFPVSDTQGIDPYVMGALLGDGNIKPHPHAEHMARLTTADFFVAEEFARRGLDMTRYYTHKSDSDAEVRTYSFGNKEFCDRLRSLGVYGCTASDKFIPEVFKVSSVDQRTQLLRGLMDTDGYVDDRGHLSYTSISSRLANDVAFVVRSLGGKATVTSKRGRGNRKVSYTVFFDIPYASNYVLLPRRRERCKDKPLIGNSACGGKVIRNIVSIGRRRGRCITVSDPNGLYVTDDFTVTHNSYLGCLWSILMCFKYPGAAGFIAREDYTALTKTTLVTFFEVLDSLPPYYKDQVVFKSGIKNYAEFANGSVIWFMHLKEKPSDPLFDAIGSFNLTFAYLDECQQISPQAVNVLRGRFSLLTGKNADGTPWKTTPKLLGCCNPKRNWIYNEFVKPFEEGDLPAYRKFIKALPADNPYVPQEYIDNLMRSDPVTIARLVYGDFHYSDDQDLLFDYDALDDLFVNKILPMGKKMISADIATKGHDRFVLYSWVGNVATIEKDRDYSPGKEIEMDIRQVATRNKVETRFIIVDADGVGNFLSSYITGIREFHGGGRPNDPKYKNIRSECYFKLAELVNKRLLKVCCTKEQAKRIKEELAVVKQLKIDNDEAKKQVISKEEMKKALGRSPDYADGLMMNMWFRSGQVITRGAKMKTLKRRA